MLTLKNVDVPEWAEWFELRFLTADRTETQMVAGRIREINQPIEALDEKKQEDNMLLAEIKDEPVPEDIERDKLIKSLQESNRELAHRVDDLMQWREHYKRLYEELLSEVLDRVNRE